MVCVYNMYAFFVNEKYKINPPLWIDRADRTRITRGKARTIRMSRCIEKCFKNDKRKKGQRGQKKKKNESLKRVLRERIRNLTYPREVLKSQLEVVASSVEMGPPHSSWTTDL